MWNKSLNFQTQLWTMLHQVLAEMKAHEKGQHIITDRSVFDQIIYYEAKLGKQSLWLQDPFYRELSLLREIALQWISIYPYTIIFWFRGFKTQTKRRQKKVDRLKFSDKSQTFWSCFVYSIIVNNHATSV